MVADSFLRLAFRLKTPTGVALLDGVIHLVKIASFHNMSVLELEYAFQSAIRRHCQLGIVDWQLSRWLRLIGF